MLIVIYTDFGKNKNIYWGNMIIIINGLPGTGKTTLCKKIANEFNFEYVNDWEIFEKKSVIFNEFDNKLLISQKYSKIIFEFINNNKEKNIVLDLEYSISPSDFVNKNIEEYTKVIYLGFVSVDEDVLYNLFKQSSANGGINVEMLLKKVKFYKEMSSVYFEDCLKNDLEFIDINRDRNEIINEIILKLQKDF